MYTKFNFLSGTASALKRACLVFKVVVGLFLNPTTEIALEKGYSFQILHIEEQLSSKS
jgi:hypothetical protein